MANVVGSTRLLERPAPGTANPLLICRRYQAGTEAVGAAAAAIVTEAERESAVGTTRLLEVSGAIVAHNLVGVLRHLTTLAQGVRTATTRVVTEVKAALDGVRTAGLRVSAAAAGIVTEVKTDRAVRPSRLRVSAAAARIVTEVETDRAVRPSRLRVSAAAARIVTEVEIAGAVRRASLAKSTRPAKADVFGRRRQQPTAPESVRSHAARAEGEVKTKSILVDSIRSARLREDAGTGVSHVLGRTAAVGVPCLDLAGTAENIGPAVGSVKAKEQVKRAVVPAGLGDRPSAATANILPPGVVAHSSCAPHGQRSAGLREDPNSAAADILIGCGQRAAADS